ncbi:MAG: T9SS type A sorting domain-containing protein [Bacteroidetes bacterium]|nr:T9SS type A sorting domain-containing protein [Bacteroidota bacterium]
MTANHIARWNGVNWSNVGTGTNARVYDLCVFNGELYVAGEFTLAGNLNANFIAKWNGTSWSSVGNGITGGCSGCGIYSLLVYNGELYAAGSIPDIVDKWNGSNWVSITGGILGAPVCNDASCLKIYNGDLYIGGSFNVIIGGDTCSNVVRYNGTGFSVVGKGIIYGIIQKLAVFNGELYISGEFPYQFGNPGSSIAKWDGNNWSDVGGGIYGTLGEGSVYSMDVFDNSLFVGGNINNAGGAGCEGIAKWDGTTWSSPGGISGGSFFGVTGLGIYNASLYATGDFTGIGGVSANHIAKWNKPIGIDDPGIESIMEFSPNPFTDQTSLKINFNCKNLSVSICNLLGHEIRKECEISDRQIVISRENLTSGIYIVYLLTNNTIISADKLVVID